MIEKIIIVTIIIEPIFEPLLSQDKRGGCFLKVCKHCKALVCCPEKVITSTRLRQSECSILVFCSTSL